MMTLENSLFALDDKFKFIHNGFNNSLFIEAATTEQITELHLIDNENEKQRILAVLLADIKWTINSDAQVSYISPFIEDCIGRDAKTIIKHVVSKYLTPASVMSCLIEFEELKEIIRTFKNTGSRKLVVELLPNESNIEKMEISIYTIFDSKGNVVGIEGLCNYVI